MPNARDFSIGVRVSSDGCNQAVATDPCCVDFRDSHQDSLCLVQVTTSGGWGGRETLPLAIHEWRLRHGLGAHLIAGEATPLAGRLGDVGHATVTRRGRLRLAIAIRHTLAGLTRSQAATHQRCVLLSHFTRDLPAIRAALFGSGHIPLVVIKHVGPGPGKRNVLHRFVYRRINRLLAVSEYIRERCERVYPIHPSRTSVWHPGVDVARFEYSEQSRRRKRQQAGRDEKDLIIGYLGRITPNKGFEELLEAARRLQAMLPALYVWIGGGSGETEQWYEQELRRRVDSLGLNDTVRFCGWQQRGQEFLSAIDVFVVPSRYEAFGLSTVEAMACARPVVGFRAAGTAEIVKDGETGLLADPNGDAASNLVNEIQDVLRHPERRQAMGDRGRQRALDLFSHDVMLERLNAELRRTDW